MMTVIVKMLLLSIGFFMMSIAFDNEIITPKINSVRDRIATQGMMKVIASCCLGAGFAL